MGGIADRIMDDYAVRRASDALSGEDMRRYGIPGGGFKSFDTAVAESEIAERLGLSHEEALHLAGHGLIAARRLMGYCFPVTPGFQNTQMAALNMLNNMIGQQFLTPDMSTEDLYAKTITELEDKQIYPLFLNRLPQSLSVN